MNESHATPKARLRKNSLSVRSVRCTRHIRARIYGCYAWIIFTILVLSFCGLAMLAGRSNRARYMARFFARLMFRLAGMPLSVTGLDRLPAEPHVLVANHTSFLDAIALTALLPASPGYTFTTKQEFALQSLLYPLLRSVRTIILKHTSQTGRTGNVDRMKSALACGENLLIFPEGEFSSEPGLKPFHSGAFVVAAQANVPVVVAGLRGARNALRLGTWLPSRSPVSLEIGPILTPCGTDSDAIQCLMAEARAAMRPLTGED